VSTAPARHATTPRRGIVAFVFVALLMTLGVATVNAVAVGDGYRDHSYNAPEVSVPSRDVPQSKTWYTDGTWWGALFSPTGASHFIHRYNASSHTWTNTGVAVDARNSSHADYLWDSTTNSLYVASLGTDSSTGPILVFKLNYNPSTNTYAHDPDFGAAGVQVGVGPAETVTIAKDSTGQLWVVYENPAGAGRNIMVNRSTTAEDVWGASFSIGSAGADDISAIIAFGGNSVGVMWSDERTDGSNLTHFRFRTHSDAAADGTWGTTVSAASGQTDEDGIETFAEDHLSLTKPSANSGEILAAVKTNNSANHIRILRRNPSTGAWSSHVVVGEGLSVSRPHVVVDSTNARAYVFYVGPENFSALDANIYYKSAPLSTLSFTTGGLGTPYINDSNVRITDVSLSKHSVTSAMGGILGIASGDNNRTYYHGWLPVGSAPPPPPPGHPFTDINTSKFKNDIIWAWEEGITVGCSATRFCPDGLVTRAQMATFLVRALDLPATSTDYFTDDEGSTHEARINSLRAAGITVGCTATTFCPDGLVTRGQMATFLVRGYDLPSTSTDYFTDDEGNTHEARINALRASGITSGCAPGRFCPNGIVTRGQMTAFLHRASINE
jgi:hypothetical protein